jgi:hypothetical protein
MHNYYHLIARAISTLESDTSLARHALYERIRAILVEQLRSRQPPASNSEIMRERAALEAAIRKIELESPTPLQSRTEPAHASGSRRSHSGAPAYSLSNTVPWRIADRSEPTTISESQHPAVESIKAADQRHSRQSSAVREQRIHSIRVVFERARVMLPDQESLRRRLASISEILRGAAKEANEQVKAVSATLVLPRAPLAQALAVRTDDCISGIKKSTAKSTIFWDATNSTEELIDPANASIFRNLAGIQLLDRLMRDAAQPLAPDSVTKDGQTVLKWLGVKSEEAIKTQHYDQFGCAVHKYIVECQDQSVRLAPATAHSPSALNDDIRGVLNRLLEREQTERVIDEALTWFAHIWIILFVVLNFIAVIGLQVVAPTLWAGIGKLAEIYSPFNVWTWIAEAIALSPCLLAIAWRNRRLKLSCGEPKAVFGTNAPADTVGLAARASLGRVMESADAII